MCCHRWAEHLALKVIPANRVEGVWVHRVRWSILLGSQEHSPPEENVRVCRSPNNTLHRLVIRVWVAVLAKQRLIMLGLVVITVRLDVSLLEMGLAIAEADSRDVAVTIEVHVGLVYRCEPVVGLDAEECPVNVLWDLARDLQIMDIALNAGWPIKALEGLGLRELCVTADLDTVDVIGLCSQALCQLEDMRHGWFPGPLGRAGGY